MLVLRGTLEGHNGWVTSLSTSAAQPNLLVSGSRDKTLISWRLTENEQQFGVPVRSYKGHSHIVQDVVVSADGNYAVSASWDKTLRLWNLATGNSEARFVGHTGDVLSVAIDANSSKIISASRDKTIRVWNTVGDCAYVLLGHTDWVTKVRVAPKNLDDGEVDDGRITFVSAGMDKIVRSWSLNEDSYRIEADFIGHNNYINVVQPSPDGSLAASAGKDGQIYVWNLKHKSAFMNFDAKDEVFALAFSPSRFWLTAATASGIKIYDLENEVLIDELKPEFAGYTKAQDPHSVSLAWSADGQTLFAGYTDNVIRVWQVMTAN
ncbi:unnamed protein product [Kluyveromyces dobzhanskii CBS 2104]|nr:unnamed protein product [Kluyveromyces dobzhanskii CBS 2104]